MYPPQPGYGPPPIDPRFIRPGRGWYGVAAGVGGTLFIVGIALVVLGFLDLAHNLKGPDTQFISGQVVQQAIQPGTDWAVFAAAPADNASTRCAVTGADGTSNGVVLVREDTSLPVHITAEGQTWTYLYKITVSQPGTYSITCGGTAALFGAGRAPATGRIIRDVLVALLGGGGLILIGIVVGVVTSVVVGVRRGRHRRSLQAGAMSGMGGPPPWGGTT